ncbi:3-deoxy-manno-octulosonate cytidylyltransferase [Vibrio campbellii]|uniref:3-deoxy-manno-octulosonate cytidylyltransferase n=1 Tax=Vibrio campbellii TaxID=680 RepID=UPI00210B8BAE|nr:3-deoxy-manno-octulosonate cytidylyltransferase [Vibrio campbellii]EHZ2591248.1 3-deoxy-manno-octulosonate cytidylyltransferase [Vibrio parahaemolyticus]
MNTVKIVIPARYGSSRLIGKPLLEINDKPIFWHVFQRCLEAGFDSRDIMLATDDTRIFEKASDLNIPVVMTSCEHDSGTDRIFEVATSQGWNKQDIVINIQGDEPLVDPELIRQLSLFTRKHTEFEITTAVVPIVHSDDFNNPNVVKAVMGLNHRALYFTRSNSPYNRELPSDLSLAFRHVGIYAYTVGALDAFCSFEEAPLEAYEKLEQLRALSNGMAIGACYFEGELAHGVDTWDDYLTIKNRMEKA